MQEHERQSIQTTSMLYVNQLTRSGLFHVRNISKLRSVLPNAELEVLIHAFISSCIDYCDAHLSSLSMSALDRLQAVPVLTKENK